MTTEPETATDTEAKSIDQRVNDLEAIVGGLVEMLDDLTTVEEPAHHTWQLNAVPDPLTLDSWVGYMNRVYTPVNAGAHAPIPDCWDLHDGLKAEIGTLYGMWRKAFYNKGATVDRGQEFHDRWLPNYAARVDTWVHKSCREGDCRQQRNRPTPQLVDTENP